MRCSQYIFAYINSMRGGIQCTDVVTTLMSPVFLTGPNSIRICWHFSFSPRRADNPLICSCELIWFPNLLQDLKNRDDEMTQKKRPMCTMANEHREYFVQSMPVERMNCIGKNLGISSLSGANTSKRLQSNLSSCTVLILSLYSVITAYFLN